MNETQFACPRGFAWCDIDDDPTRHRFIVGHGIEFYYNETERDAFIDWSPYWDEWRIAPGQVRAELRGIRHTLAGLEQQFGQFCTIVGLSEPTGEAPAEDLRPCPVNGCLTAVHPWRNDEQAESCVATRLDHPSGWFKVVASKSPGESKWEVWTDANNLPDGADGLEAIESLARDYAAVHEWCTRLNEAEAKA